MNSRTWNALAQARQARVELEEGIFPSTVEKILAEENVSVNVIPLQPLPNQAVSLEVVFNSKAMNTCMARNEFECVWDFGALGKEEGWRISHYFASQDEATFSVSFRRPDGEMIMKAGSDNIKARKEHPITLQRATGKRKYGERAKIERIQLAVALAIALIGLFAGAREQLMKLDVFSGLIGVFLIGFGADTVKNLITKRSPEEA